MNNLLEMIKSLDGQKTMGLIVAATIMAIFDIFSPIFSYIILKIFNIKKSKKKIKENTFYSALVGFLQITGVYIAIIYLKPIFNFSEDLINIVTKIYKVIVTITIAISLANSITKKSKFINLIKEKSDKEYNDGATKILVRIVKGIIYIVATFIVFKEIGYDLSGLITGLGLGSVILTLAAQDTIKNLLGGIIIYMDRPFMVGDHIKCLDYKGTVEDMTLRSTRIRAIDNSVIQVPNALIASSAVENLSKIMTRRYELELELVLDTKMEKIDVLKQIIYQRLMENEFVIKEKINLHFTEIGANGFKLIVACYFNTADYMEFLDLKEELNKQIMTIINEENIGLAYDTKTIEIKK